LRRSESLGRRRLLHTPYFAFGYPRIPRKNPFCGGRADGDGVHQVAESIDLRPEHRILSPNRDVWREAGILAGLLGRLQHYGKNERRKVLDDALLYLTATRNGCVVLTRYVLDFDLLMQLDGTEEAVFYS
jgi:hypothetical protein